MSENDPIGRRQLLTGGAAAMAMALGGALAQESSAKGLDPDKGVTAPEDLMKEHGVLNRCLLIYEEGIRRLRETGDLPPAVLRQTAELVKKFVEEYHEKNEEKFIFPVFVKAGKLTDLVATLKTQHKAGRVVTAEIIRLSGPGGFKGEDERKQVIAAVERFIRMYRPHEAREDTVLFPALRTLLTPKQVESIGERMEGAEHAVLGNEGFERSVAAVAAIEKQLGIYDLKQFTPK